MRIANLTSHFAAWILLLVIAGTASGDVIYVEPGESIQAAIDASSNGDEIEVAPGTYNEAIDFMGKTVWLYSSGGPEVTTIDGTGNYHVIQCVSGEGPDTILAGFTITGGNATSLFPDNRGGGLYNYFSSPTVTNCTFTGNWARYGGGMSNDGSSPTLTNCTFYANMAGYWGGGMLNYDGNPTVTNCTFYANMAGYGGAMYNKNNSPTVMGCTFKDNTADLSGGGMYNENNSPTLINCFFNNNGASVGGGMCNYYTSSPMVTNCAFSGNWGGYRGGGIANSENSSPTVTNCTLSSNEANYGGGMYNYNSSPTVTNCIMWGNMVLDSGNEIFNDFSTPAISYSDIAGCGGSSSWDTSLGSDGGGNIDADPLFVDADGPDDIAGTEDDNLRLFSDSPCIEGGDNNAVPAGVTTDLDGLPRIINVVVDMGVYEFQELPFICVDTNAAGANNGTNWFNAFNHLQDGLAEADYGNTILVAEGTYSPDEDTANPAGTGLRTDTFGLISGVAIYGGFPSGGGTWEDRDPILYETILSGDLNEDDGPDFANNNENSYRVVMASNTDTNTILDGFTITAGNGNGSLPNDRGGGMYIDGSPTVKNCIFTENRADSFGGGICIHWDGYSRPTLTNCIFSGNYATNGGGMFNHASSEAMLFNCIFVANWAVNGGGMSNYVGEPSVINCTFSGNRATNHAGGIYNNNSNPILTNDILWGNIDGGTADESQQIVNTTSTPVINYCCVQGWTGAMGGEGNIGDDPLFKDADGDDDIYGTEDDNLQLAYDSPCIDAGDSNSVPADYADLDEDGDTSEQTPLDLAYNDRFTDDPVIADTGTGTPPIVDMGVYERYEFCGDANHPYPPGDENGDCVFDLNDFAIMAQYWLQYTGPE